MVGNDSSVWSQDETIRILIASDIHLGYLEEHPVRGEDSFIAFEETLSLAVQYDVDLILLGGDLFHHAKPSLNCIYKCMEIVRKYCLGDKPVSIELLSDQTINFSRNVNYEDPNLNVSYPILSIHGNHDDPVGREGISSLDLLSTGGLVNYFGKWTDYTHVRISPVLLQKGDSKLALYGLSHLKDQRLSHLFQEKKVEMLRDEQHDWFNILVLHQNRAEDRGAGNFIKEAELPTFLDLIVWGHEHDCELYDMKGNREADHFNVIQPGSTVATSLAAGEARPKHCALLQIHKNDYILTALPLKTVRPFIFKTVVLSEHNLGDEDVNESEKVQEYLKQKVNEAIVEAQNLLSGDPRQPTMPLIRLSVFYEREDQIFNRARFGQNFTGQVANSNDILLLKRERKIREKRQGHEEEVDVADYVADSTNVETLLRAYYDALPPERRLAALPVQLMTEAVRDFTIKQHEEILRFALDAYRRRCITTLIESNTDTDIEAIADRLRVLRDEIDAADVTQLAALKAAAPAQIVIEGSSDEEPTRSEAETAVRGRGRGARGPRGGRARGPRAGRGRAEPRPRRRPPPAPPAAAPERRTPRRTAAQKTATWIQNFASKARRRDSSDIDDSD
ncbi:LOW QUALITY PROTEIN: double-strand break repair protein MRE11 [Helicoverpa armigera]|uniref:LOW QUALITY PROTEIN: double-strand break repair protein MRE11 n=1 Tax=Helicoverpa armigera TaxID=29058 RepID=UPI003082E1CF